MRGRLDTDRVHLAADHRASPRRAAIGHEVNNVGKLHTLQDRVPVRCAPVRRRLLARCAQSRPRPKLRSVLWEMGGSFSLTRESGARWVLKVDEVGILRRVRLNPQIKQMAGISGIYKSAKSAQSVDRRVS